MSEASRCVLFDWGDTLMRVPPGFAGPMCTWPRVEVVCGVKEALTELQRSWMLALATNAVDSREQDIWSALERGGIEGLIDRVYCYRRIGHRKPSPEYFDYVLNDLGMERDKVVMVGDDFEQDVLGASGSGIRAIWFHEHGDELRTNHMHWTIPEMSELPQALERLMDHAGRTPQ